MKSWVVIPVHDRRETTLGCLRVLRAQEVTKWAGVVVVDDGSRDGTAASVGAEFPEVVILRGDGNLWWGGGINVGMQWAFDQGAEFVMWLNDDTLPRAGTLSRLMNVSKERRAITTGPCVLRETGELHYGGLQRTRTGTAFAACGAEEILACDTICGNCVCIPRSAFERVGLVDTEAFPHFAGDADYGLRAKEAGVPILIVGDALCECSYGNAKNRQSWLLGDQSLAELWRGCFDVHNGVLSRGGIIFRVRHWGPRGLVWLVMCLVRLVMITMLRVLIPRAALLRLAGRKNVSHERIEAVRRWEASQAKAWR